MQFLNNLIWFLAGGLVFTLVLLRVLRRHFQKLAGKYSRMEAGRTAGINRGATPRERSRERISMLIDRQIAESVVEAGDDGRRAG